MIMSVSSYKMAINEDVRPDVQTICERQIIDAIEFEFDLVVSILPTYDFNKYTELSVARNIFVFSCMHQFNGRFSILRSMLIAVDKWMWDAREDLYQQSQDTEIDTEKR